MTQSVAHHLGERRPSFVSSFLNHVAHCVALPPSLPIPLLLPLPGRALALVCGGAACAFTWAQGLLNAGALNAQKGAGAFVKGEWGTAICDGMTPSSTADVVVEGKRGLCGFASTNLDFILRQRGIKNVALAGFAVSECLHVQGCIHILTSALFTAFPDGCNALVLDV